MVLIIPLDSYRLVSPTSSSVASSTRLLLIEHPDPTCLAVINRLPDFIRQTFKNRMLISPGEIFPLPFMALLLLLLPHLTLLVLDDGLLIAGCVSVSLYNGIGNLFPCTPCLHFTLLLHRCH